jgi:hypothetical protein
MKKVILFTALCVSHLLWRGAGGEALAQNRVPGTVVTAPVVPNDTRDDIATHIDTLGYGGFRSVTTKAEMYGIKPGRRKIGMRVHVADENVDSVFVLKGGLANAHWVPVPEGAFLQETFFVSTNPDNWDGFRYPYPIPTYDAGKPIPFRQPFEDVSYSLIVSCYNNRGLIPYIITGRTPESFTIKIVESCICSYTANRQ